MKISDGLIAPMAMSIPSHFLFEDYYNRGFFLLRTNGNMKCVFIKVTYFYGTYKNRFIYTTHTKSYTSFQVEIPYYFFLIQYIKILALCVQLRCYVYMSNTLVKIYYSFM